jgi:hypothetical protein
MLKQAQPAAIPLSTSKPFIGSLGHMGIFLWALSMVLFPPLSRGILLALFTLGTLTLIYPPALQRLAPTLVIFGSLFINIFFGESISAILTVLVVSFNHNHLNSINDSACCGHVLQTGFRARSIL